jgi:hypothetical protein
MLLAGNSGQGTVLTGEVQGVTAGIGVTIAPNGALSINGNDPAFNGFVKTNNGSAYNGYIWPSGDGLAGQQLQTNGSGTLTWADADGIPWTQKGQLVASTGAGTINQALVNAGANTAFLIANSSTTTGLSYTDAVNTAALLPDGVTNDRPVGPLAGQVRFNTTNQEFEGYGAGTYTNPAATWQYLSSMPTGPVTAATGATNKIFYQNASVVTEDYTTPTTANSLSAGPITIAVGKTVTVPVGSTWTIV